jgi:hypothetical protein
MKLLIATTVVSIALMTPVLAQGQGGYAPGVAGADTAAMSSSERADARAHHATNDTSGGASSIDKSGKTSEAGGTDAGPQQGEAARAGTDDRRGQGQ